MSKRKLPKLGRRPIDDKGVTRGMDAALKATSAERRKPDEADAPPLSTFPMTPAAKEALRMWTRPLGGAPGARAREDTPMTTAELDAAIQQAETDLAFALAQGDGYAEDEAAERLAKAKRDREAWIEGLNVAAELIRLDPSLRDA